MVSDTALATVIEFRTVKDWSIPSKVKVQLNVVTVFWTIVENFKIKVFNKQLFNNMFLNHNQKKNTWSDNILSGGPYSLTKWQMPSATPFAHLSFRGTKTTHLIFTKMFFFFVRGFRTYLCWYWVHWTIQNNKLYFCYVPLWSSPWMLGHTCTCCWTQLMDQPGPFQLIPKVSKLK